MTTPTLGAERVRLDCDPDSDTAVGRVATSRHRRPEKLRCLSSPQATE